MSDVPVGLPARLKAWPWPALGAWAAGWLLLQASLRWDAGPWLSLALGWLPSLAVAISVRGRWRRVLLIAGWPAILGLAAVAAWPGWVWLALACGVLLFYPLSAWRDAPLFPTPRDALQGLSAHIALPQDARLLDAGSGLGHGLAALRQAFPRARIEGIERSGLLVLASRVRPVAGARVRRGDLWSVSWRDYDLVYLFQRPESMAPAWRKACAEMRPGSWVVPDQVLDDKGEHAPSDRLDDETLTVRAGVWRPWRAYGALHLALAGISGNQLMESDDAKRAA